MDKHKCKFCLKNFADGKALGGHMRSHMINPTHLLDSSSYSSSDDEKMLLYELRENPKKSFRLLDQEFGLVLESKTELSDNPIRRRSKRIQKLLVEPEPMSSISDSTTEEYAAYTLMMLSRDKWNREKNEEEEEEKDEDYEDEKSDSESEIKVNKSSRVRGKYKCETCNKVFRSYQALGGHRASHKKIRLSQNVLSHSNVVVEEKVHECPVCYRVFSSGQALGGHKRSHGIGSATNVSTSARPVVKREEIFIDLNLPAPVDDDDDDFSQDSDSDEVMNG